MLLAKHGMISAKERILNSIADEQESLAKIIKYLAVKVEKTASWLPNSLPDCSIHEIVDHVKCLEEVIARELCATASKEQAIREVLNQICKCDFNHSKNDCPCPCQFYHICKITGKCVKYQC